MVTLRATKKVLGTLSVAAVEAPRSDTALGDWYVNRMVVSRQPILLFVSSTSLLAMLVPARDVRSLPNRLPELVAARLQRLRIADAIIEAELVAMEPVCVAPTASRSILGSMRDFMQLIPYYVSQDGVRDDGLYIAEAKLGESPCRVTRSDAETIWPSQKARELLTTAWQVGPNPGHDEEVAAPISHARRMHVPFLERASSDGGCDPLTLGAFLVLRVADCVFAEPTNMIGMMNQVRPVHEYLDDLFDEQEVWFLRAILSACETLVRESGLPDTVANALSDYARWLSTEGRHAEGSHVTLMAEEWNAV